MEGSRLNNVKTLIKKTEEKQTHPKGQSKLSSGLTNGTSDFEIKLPST